MSGSKLLEIMKYLENKRNNYSGIYAIPLLWNKWGYRGKEIKKINDGEILVNPYNYYYELINSYILPLKKEKNYNIPYHQIYPYVVNSSSYLGGDWVKESIVYSMMIRTSTSWDHDKNGELDILNNDGIKETGTFIKTLTLLPHLKKMGVDVIYLLPITKYSLKDKKGELGSPYSVSNFYQLDENLKDPLIGDEFSVDDEFAAFVEACHILDMKVMIDIIPRTIAIENDLIIDHPEWFYWIKSSEKASYKPPRVSTLGSTVSPTPDVLSDIYLSEEVWQHINKFSKNPKEIDVEKYQKLVNRCRENKTLKISDLIKEEFGIEIAPAFSDHINDPQPAWTDITFFRMYEDHPTLSKQELSKYHHDCDSIPPYILFDTIKCNLYQGLKPNLELWEMISNIIPYYQQKFGIDGARIDMGHALPNELLEMIINRARNNDEHFCFIAEELDTSNAKKARNIGYNMIIGNSFWHLVRVKEGNLHNFINNVYKLECPVFACAENHDTPRLASRDGGKKFAHMLSLLNMFIPNAIPFINSGQEVYEMQPMNTGLDVQENALYMLDENDPFYMKLALFDKYALHYLNDGYEELTSNLYQVAKIRKDYLDLVTNVNNYLPRENNKKNEYISLAYLDKDKQEILLILVSTNFNDDINVKLEFTDYDVKQLFSQYNNELVIKDKEILLKPMEFKILLLS